MNDLITLTCPSCGGQLEVKIGTASLVCKHCGNEHTVRREAGTIMLEAHARCPRCGRNDKVEKATSIRSSQTQQANIMEQRVIGYGKHARMVSAPVMHTQMSSLASQLEPPSKPLPAPQPKLVKSQMELVGILCTVLTGLCLLSWLFGMSITLERSDYNPTTMILCCSPLFTGLLGTGILLAISGHKKSTRLGEQYRIDAQKARNMEAQATCAWESAMERWNKLYYCSRDDCVFIPGEGTWSSLHQMLEYVCHPQP